MYFTSTCAHFCTDETKLSAVQRFAFFHSYNKKVYFFLPENNK